MWSVSCVMREGVDCEWYGDGEERGVECELCDEGGCGL